ncbi:hypothetical protein A3B51_02800 [Candidatus Curtissbacteria bacterium RIFCSPLOWO2_01_FULL_41_18]|uniref:Uncharacterized protein n=2 Tax=Candidatus Curtissiibacteriota TaxID=1752717 RepID=A0A1F5G0Y9_9BACT|nr:MAG: hypothetical protein A2696_00710 [Candidatus Curtissbacteria bacterium RIFCSPHIGHO2_01_FULL_41_13]OGE05428.1 MAG: hypothetical protein A3B51_02800 [Candidatus Curtissbacteria bacterium RIFCSPLOWO2_01_FULL_41_18]
MNAQDLVLNIAVNLGRISRWAQEGKEKRIKQFLAETQIYLDELEKVPRSRKFEKTYQNFKTKFANLKNKVDLDEVWAEEMLTWSNILTHRAKLA